MMPHDVLTAQERKLLYALRASGAWMSRAELARGIGTKELGAYNIALLKNMTAKGFVEVRRFRTTDGVLAYHYRETRR